MLDLETEFNDFRAQMEIEKRADIARISPTTPSYIQPAYPAGDIPLVLNFLVLGTGEVLKAPEQTIQFLHKYERVSLSNFEKMWRPNILRHCREAYDGHRNARIRPVSYSTIVTTTAVYERGESLEDSRFQINMVLLSGLGKILEAGDPTFVLDGVSINWNELKSIMNDAFVDRSVGTQPTVAL